MQICHSPLTQFDDEGVGFYPHKSQERAPLSSDTSQGCIALG